MKLKRTVGTGKIFFYSCAPVLAFAGIVWLVVNVGYAVYLSGKTPSTLWIRYNEGAADAFTPWLLMAASMAVYYRYWKICGANNVSCIKQTMVFSLLSIFVSTAFAAADLLTVKLVMQPVYGGIVLTRIEDDSYYFIKFINDYIHATETVGTAKTVTDSPYPLKAILLLFAIMAVYYYCCFLVGGYIMQCFKYRKKKLLIYYACTSAYVIFLLAADSIVESILTNAALEICFILLVIIVFLTNPVIFLSSFQYFANGYIDGTVTFLTIFILITTASIKVLDSEQFPSKRKIKKALKNYNLQNQNNCGKGGIK